MQIPVDIKAIFDEATDIDAARQTPVFAAVYIDESADYAMAEAITVNAKTQRTSVCNCAETLIMQESWAEKHGEAPDEPERKPC